MPTIGVIPLIAIGLLVLLLSGACFAVPAYLVVNDSAYSAYKGIGAFVTMLGFYLGYLGVYLLVLGFDRYSSTETRLEERYRK